MSNSSQTQQTQSKDARTVVDKCSMQLRNKIDKLRQDLLSFTPKEQKKEIARVDQLVKHGAMLSKLAS